MVYRVRMNVTTHPYQHAEWTLVFLSELARVSPGRRDDTKAIADRMWTIIGVEGVWPDVALERFLRGEFNR